MNNWWNDPSIPAQQLAIVRPELEQIKAGNIIPPYRQFFKCLHPVFESDAAVWSRKVLDVGAGVGHYGEALRLFLCVPVEDLAVIPPIDYTAVDVSKSFRDAAITEFPWMKYDVGEASNLPYEPATFDVVLSSACLMYAEDPMRDIWEATRVSSGYVIFHRTPIEKETRKVEAEAYGGTVLETRFSEADLFGMFDKAGLSLVHTETIFEMPDGYGHKTYLLKKDPVFPISA